MPVRIKVIACSQVRRAVRATLILFPLLGMTNLLFFINPKVSFASYPTFLSLFCLSFSSLSSISFLSSLALSTSHHCLILKFPQLTLKVEHFQTLNIPEHQYIYMVVNSVLRSSQVRAKIWKTEEILNLFQQEPLLLKKNYPIFHLCILFSKSDCGQFESIIGHGQIIQSIYLPRLNPNSLSMGLEMQS